jgi:hypothetical protein
VAVCAGLLATGCLHEDPPARPDQVLQADAGHAWYRGNLHAHTLWSDGDEFPESVVERYRRAGYQFLALTDHDRLQEGEAWIEPQGRAAGGEARVRATRAFAAVPESRSVDGRMQVRLRRFRELEQHFAQPGHFLLLPAEEISDAVGPLSIHVNAIGVGAAVAPAREREDVALSIARDYEAATAAARQPGSLLLQLNHPNFTYSVTAEQLMRLRGSPFFEVFNGHPLSNNLGDGLHPPVERLWDIALAWRLDVLGLPLLYATATDDSHHYAPGGDATPGRGWIEVLSPALRADALFDAMHAGRFYASTGVRLRRIVATDDRLEVEVEPQPGVEHTIEFIGTRRGFDTRSTLPVSATGRAIHASRRYSDKIGRVLSRRSGPRATYRFAPDDLYVRARVTSSLRHADPSQPFQYAQAWVQPVIGPAGHAPSRRNVEVPAPPAPVLHLGVTRRFQRMAPGEVAALRGSPAVPCSLDGTGQDPRPGAGVSFFGWLADTDAGTAPASIAVVLADGAGNGFVAETGAGRRRPDVAKAFSSPGLEGSGFHAEFEPGAVPSGRYGVWLVGDFAGMSRACNSGKSVNLR